MISQISERKISVIRWGMVLGWAFIATMLLNDALSLNQSANEIITIESSVLFQGQPINIEPFSLFNKIFWTIIIPLIPVSLLLFGHSTWRRICPLSAIMQIPRKLNIQFSKKIISKDGEITRSKLEVNKNSWLAKNYWYLQFFILFSAVTGRILFYNADPIGLLVIFSTLIISALIMGYLFSGKTWCHYICPMGPVQKFYSGTSGLLEQKAHFSNSNITQSMCRTSDNKSNCVACKTDCPDIDLEKNYWSEITENGRKFFYFGFPGLVIGFYLYYFLYSGNWEYVFTGQPVKDINQIQSLLNPGLFINNQIIKIPKIIAAPGVIALCILLTNIIGRTLQNHYQNLRLKAGSPLSEKEYLHAAFNISVFITFNVFYIFSGRSNLNSLPFYLTYIIDFSLIAFSTIWLVKSFKRTAQEYKIESVGNTLRNNIKRSPINWNEVLENRSVVDLSHHEIYALARIMPKISKSESSTIYKEALSDAFYRGDLKTEQGLMIIDDLKTKLHISQKQHEAFLNDLISNNITTHNI
ncbi:4Fe-4S binding protein [Marinicellulosiphila megalodicopiae]|uniref:4Fe-4S binding protein n=1 Tax=Marinicellulosiphila megalodicopiae TaxID=2724896 RepID=UPI003BB1F9E9